MDNKEFLKELAINSGMTKKEKRKLGIKDTKMKKPKIEKEKPVTPGIFGF